MTTAAETQPDVFKVTDALGLPNFRPGDYIVVWPDGRITLQRDIEPETFTALGTGDALVPLPSRGGQPEEDLAAAIGNAAGKLRKLVDELYRKEQGVFRDRRGTPGSPGSGIALRPDGMGWASVMIAGAFFLGKK